MRGGGRWHLHLAGGWRALGDKRQREALWRRRPEPLAGAAESGAERGLGAREVSLKDFKGLGRRRLHFASVISHFILFLVIFYVVYHLVDCNKIGRRSRITHGNTTWTCLESPEAVFVDGPKGELAIHLALSLLQLPQALSFMAFIWLFAWPLCLRSS